MEHLEDIYNHIKNHIKKEGFPPSGRQIADALKLDYELEVKPAVDQLILEGKIKVNEMKTKIIDILD